MRIVLADLRGREGFVSKDTVAGGYGSRLRPFSKTTELVSLVKRCTHDVPSVQLAYLAALAARHGHAVRWTRDEYADGDVAIVLSSLVDYRQETAWARGMQRRGVRVGFVGLAASKMPHLFAEHADFVIRGEPEAAFADLANGATLEGVVDSRALPDLDVLPFPRWDLVGAPMQARMRLPWGVRPFGGVFPVLASRGCPEFCTYCPHRILETHRARSVDNIVSELEYVCRLTPHPYVLFRDPLFSEDRNRCLALADAILARGLTLTFECETRLDRLDPSLLDTLQRAGLRAISFGVESLSPQTLKQAGRRPIPVDHQRTVLDHCRRIGIATAAFYVFGFPQDDWSSIAATIAYAIQLDSTVAQFKLLTPYPGTPLWRQLESRIFENDWERFDGFTPTFTHPNLTPEQLRFLLGAAYSRFYVRPSYAAHCFRLVKSRPGRITRRLDSLVASYQSRGETASMSRAVTC
ncbi:MAG TPA: radical SAM protein [Vicinamibacterales bacterium]|nr:radical SAM protein [Vicinamibacterales bacterium]